MDNKYYSGVIAEMQNFFDENGFTVNKDKEYIAENKAVKVEYNEERQTYELYIAQVTENEKGEYVLASSWLFDDTQTEKDAGSVGIDFVNTLRDSMGIKVKRTVSSANAVDLPTASADGSMKTTGFAKKVLDVYPQYKDAYKEHVAKYGNFLYMEFFAETFIPTITEVLRKGEKKQTKKLYELLENAYTTGDRETVNIAVASLAAAVLKDETLKEKADELLAEDTHFKASLDAFIPVLKADKKLFTALVK